MLKPFLYPCAIFILTLMISCSSSIEKEKTKLTELLDSVGKIYVPDKRQAIWNYEISDTTGILELSIESELKKGLEHLEKQLTNDFPELKYKLTLLPDSALKGKTFGLINVSACNMRKNPKHSAELVNQELMGTPVKVFKKESGWFLIQSPNGYVGWIDAPAISRRTEAEMNKLASEVYIIFTKPYGQVFKNAQKTEIVSDIVLGNILKLTENHQNVYEVALPDGRTGYVEKEGFVDLKSLRYKTEINTKQIVEFAKQFMGTSYLWGGKSSKAIDCSGYSAIIYFFNGIILQRDASQQIKFGERIKNADFSKLEIGDLLFFGRKATDTKPEKVTHVGIYIGNGEFIHASGMVRVSSLDPQKENFDETYVRMFLVAKRVLNSVGTEGIDKIEDNQYFKYFF